jgi:hypothetical protein
MLKLIRFAYLASGLVLFRHFTSERLYFGSSWHRWKSPTAYVTSLAAYVTSLADYLESYVDL